MEAFSYFPAREELEGSACAVEEQAKVLKSVKLDAKGNAHEASKNNKGFVVNKKWGVKLVYGEGNKW